MLNLVIISAAIIRGATPAPAVASPVPPLPASVSPATPGSEPTLLDSVVVSGRVSGPGMWQVYKDDGHDLWILGEVKPLPANIEWDSSVARDMVTQSQEVLWYPGYGVNVQANLFQQAMLGYGYLKAKKNPDGESLAQVLDPALHGRWKAAKAEYMPRNSSVEDKRPIFAAEELLEAAIKRKGLTNEYSFYDAMKPVMEEAGVRSHYPQFEVKVSNAVAKAALTDVRRMRLDDAACLSATLDAIDTDLPRMVANANAWANGNVASISYAALAKRDELCSDALMSPAFSAKYGLPNIKDSIANLWLTEARTALAKNASTVAFVPMEHLTGPNSLMERLRAMGYTVSSP